MPQADGTVLIDTEINSDGAEAGTKELELAARRLAKSVQGIGEKAEIALQKQVDAFARLNNQYYQQAQKVDELKKKIAEYENQKLPTQEYADIKNQIDSAQSKLDSLIQKQEKFLELGGKKNSKAYKSMQYDIDELANTIRYAQTELSELVASGKAFSFGINTEDAQRDMKKLAREEDKLKGLNDRLRTSYTSLGQKVNEYKSGLQKTNSEHKKGGKLLSLFKKHLDKTKKSVDKARFSLGKMLATSVLFSFVFRAINTVTSGIKEGMDNLAQYSDETNAALSLLLSSLTQLKNAFATAFAPVVEYVAPALSNLINLLTEAVTWIAQLFAALTGNDTYVRALKVQQDYADSLDKTGEAAKDAEKALAPFDKLIQISYGNENKNDQELLPEDIFTTEEVANDIKIQADKIKEVFDRLFDPLKSAWEKYGPGVIESIKNAFGSLKQAAAAVGESFLRAWDDLGYGERITGNLLQGFGNLVDTVGILADRFREAWEAGGLGDAIMENLLAILETLSQKFLEATEIIKEWASGIDFTPILTAFNNLLEAINPIVDTIGDALLWLLEEVLLPLASWTIEDVIPAFFNLLAATLTAVNAVLQALQPLWEWFWDSVLAKIASFVGDAFITFLNFLVDALYAFSEWCKEHQGIIQNAAIVITSFIAAWGAVKVVTTIIGIVNALKVFVSGVSAAISAAGGMGAALAALMGPAGIAVAAIGAVIAVIGLLIYNWDDVSAATKKAADFISQRVGDLKTSVVESLKKIADDASGTFSSLYETATNGMSRIMQSISRRLSEILNLFKTIWNGCFSVVSDIWRNIVSFVSGAIGELRAAIEVGLNTIRNIFSSVFNSLISIVTTPFRIIEQVITGFVNVITSIIDRIADAIARVSESVSNFFGNSKSSNVTVSSRMTYAAYQTPVPYSIPTFATGTVIPPRAGLSLAGVGDSLETEYIAPESKMKQAFKDAIMEMGGIGNQVAEAVMEIDGTKFGKLIVKFGNNERNRVGVRMVSEGTV